MSKHTIEILGKGCGSCTWTERLVREVVAETGADVQIEKVTNTSEMVAWRHVDAGLVIDDRVVHVGGVPTKKDVQRWVLGLQA